MESVLEVILLGLIEGVTEFLPISSTGHLLIAQHWLERRSDLFNIAIQTGAISAVVLIYWRRLWLMTVGFRDPVQRDYLIKLSAAFAITALGGYIAKAAGLELPETVMPVAWALVLGGIAILIIERIAAQRPEVVAITWKVVIWVGLAQVLAAVFPGTSRSAATIFAAMLAGCNSRPAATEFAFLVGIPTMFAAAGYEALSQRDAFHSESFLELALGFLVSAVVAFIAVKWLLRYIQTHRFTAFAWYRIVLGLGLLVAL